MCIRDRPGAGLQVNYLVSANGSVAVSDTIIRNNHATSTGGGLYVSAGTTAVFTANLIAGNSADSQYGAGFVTCSGQNSLFYNLSLIHISEPTRLLSISYAVFCLKKK